MVICHRGFSYIVMYIAWVSYNQRYIIIIVHQPSAGVLDYTDAQKKSNYLAFVLSFFIIPVLLFVTSLYHFVGFIVIFKSQHAMPPMRWDIVVHLRVYTGTFYIDGQKWIDIFFFLFVRRSFLAIGILGYRFCTMQW